MVVGRLAAVRIRARLSTHGLVLGCAVIAAAGAAFAVAVPHPGASLATQLRTG